MAADEQVLQKSLKADEEDSCQEDKPKSDHITVEKLLKPEDIVLKRMNTEDKPPGGGQKKKSISHWHQYKTVSWRADAAKDYDEHTSRIMHDESVLTQAVHELPSWAIPAVVGVLTACSGAYIEKNVEWFSAYRFGYCPWNPFYTTPENCEDWVAWENGYLMFVLVTTAIATISATLTWAYAPMSRGSGIPEIKMILGGFNFEEALAGNTLVIKIIGLSMSVGAGLSCGKEGPLVHIACCWSHFIAKFFARYKDNDAKQRELLSCACAAGVAVAFGAPLGGVLFSFEEASTIFPTRTMLRAFFGASVAALTLSWLNPTGSGKLTMFNEPYAVPPMFSEYPLFVLLGIAGGCIGAFFVHYNMMVSRNRAPGTPFRKKCHIVLEVCIIGLVTGITSYHLLMTRVLSNVSIRALFHDCQDHTASRHEFMLDLCDGYKPALTSEVCYWVLLTGLLRFGQMIFTFGTGAAAGLFIPNLLTGACLGRLVGIAAFVVNEHVHFAVKDVGGGEYINLIKPGMYAMLGAAGVLGGACRVTISLVVIMFELTGGLQLVVPFMIVCTLAKWIGDLFTIGIYDAIILVRKYPFLHEPDEVMYTHTAQDVMDESIDCLHPEVGTLGAVIEFLEKGKYGGYPLTKSADDQTLLGYVHTYPLLKFLKMRKSENSFYDDNLPISFRKFMDDGDKAKMNSPALDISKFCDPNVMTCVAETPAVQVQSVFRYLGVKTMLVRERGYLIGMITKKAFISHMEELHHSDHATTSKGGLKEALLPK